MLDLKLRYFIMVAKHGSFTLASQYLYTSQSNVSKQISELEKELEFSLFSRENRGIRLTSAGQYLYNKISYVPGFLDQTITEARQIAQQEEQRIFVGIAEELYAAPWMLQLLSKLQHTFPEVHFQFDSAPLQALRLGLSNHCYDLIFSWQHDIQHIQEYSFTPISVLPFAVMMPKEHPLAGQGSLCLKNLEEEQILIYDEKISAGSYEWFRQKTQSISFIREPVPMASYALWY